MYYYKLRQMDGYRLLCVYWDLIARKSRLLLREDKVKCVQPIGIKRYTIGLQALARAGWIESEEWAIRRRARGINRR